MSYTLEQIEEKIANSPPHVKGVWEGEKRKLLQKQSANHHNNIIWKNLNKVFKPEKDIVETVEEVINPVDEEVEIFVQPEVEVCEPCVEVKKRKPRKKAAKKKVAKQEEEE